MLVLKRVTVRLIFLFVRRSIGKEIAVFFKDVLGTRFGSLESEIGSLQIHTRFLTFSLKKPGNSVLYYSISNMKIIYGVLFHFKALFLF